MTLQELNEMEAELLKRLDFAKKVQANTKPIEKQLIIVKLAKIGINSNIKDFYEN